MTKLITYPDSLGGNLKELEQVLEEDFKGVFSGVHILPPYPSSGDRGFAPIDYKQIDPRFGNWDDISRIAQKYDLTLDFMVNHVSAQSKMFKDYLENGDDSEYKDFFLTPEKIFDKNEPSEDDIKNLVLRRKRPWSDYKLENGETVRIWTTFGGQDPSEQLDVDINTDIVRNYYKDLFEFFASKGLKELRMDAIAYAVKKPGTSCFFVEPEIYDFMNWIEAEANKAGIKILHEIHAPLKDMRKLAQKKYQNYDFLISYAILEALLIKDAKLLVKLLEDPDRPDDWVTLIDCHDGIPVQPDMNGILNEADMVEVVNISEKNGAKFTELHSTEKAYENAPNVHQICGTLYSLLGEDDDSFVLARAMQLFVPGIPQVYYEGIFGGVHDYPEYERTGDGRELNRRNYSRADIREALQRERTQRILKLIEFRNKNKFYEGDFSLEYSENKLELIWTNISDKYDTKLEIDLTSLEAKIITSESGKEEVFKI